MTHPHPREDSSCLCPICMEELDITDKSFKPCQCGFQLCLWCWHNINEKSNGKCPSCRRPYSREPLGMKSVDPQIVALAEEERKLKKQKERVERDKYRSTKDIIPVTNHGKVQKEAKDLANMRIMQRNLMYVVGLPLSLAKEDILKSKEYFGQYGKITKVAVNRKHTHSSSSKGTCSAYITYKQDQNAFEAIKGTNGHMLDGKLVKATYGTTKYCSFFLRGVACSNPNCLYLHQMANNQDSFSKEDLAATDRFHVKHITGGSSNYSYTDLYNEVPKPTVESVSDISITEAPEVSTSTSSIKQESSFSSYKSAKEKSLFSGNFSSSFAGTQNKAYISSYTPKKSRSIISSTESHSRVNLPGLSSFGADFTESLGWTPAKQSTSKSTSRFPFASEYRLQSSDSSDNRSVQSSTTNLSHNNRSWLSTPDNHGAPNETRLPLFKSLSLNRDNTLGNYQSIDQQPPGFSSGQTLQRPQRNTQTGRTKEDSNRSHTHNQFRFEYY